MLIPFGILSAAGVSGEVPSDYELITTTILGTTAASITFSGLAAYASIYKHLQIRAVVRSDRAGLDRDLFYGRLNGDTGNNYSAHSLVGPGNAVVSFNAIPTSVFELFSYLPAATSTSGEFGAYVLDLLDAYSTSKNKTIRGLSSGTIRSSESGIILTSGVWRNTNAVTEAVLFSGTSNSFIAGSRFSLYGIRG
jgi:hypothetical protein